LQLSTAFIESMIALSILFLAGEVVRRQRAGRSLATERPWLVAFIFGLFHGMGFGGALLDIGFPSEALVVALALFNVGVELGQLGFIAALLLLAALLNRLLARWPRWRSSLVQAVPVYLIGIAGAYWVMQRGLLWLQALA
jgi:hypothetical protein